jgi:hypothetical protein
MTITVIHQPDFLPYLGFFDRLLDADVLVYLDHVQFTSGGKECWTNRDKIKSPNGPVWLTVSVRKALLGTPINEIMLADNGWQQKNLSLIYENYRYADYFNEFYPVLERVYQLPLQTLTEFNELMLASIMNLLLDKVPIIVKSSGMGVGGYKNDLLVKILEELNSHTYISGIGARSYIDQDKFHKNGIQLIWQNFTHPIYPQQFDRFIPNLSCIDLLMNCGAQTSKNILKGNHEYPRNRSAF